MKEANEERSFYFKDGQQAKNLWELQNALELMDRKTFLHHVNEEGNDFSNWVKDVLEDEELALHLSRAQGRKNSQITVLKRMIEHAEGAR